MMTREHITPLSIILEKVKDAIEIMKNQPEWLSNPELSRLLHISQSTIQQFKDRPAFLPYRRNPKKGEKGVQFKNCPEMIKLLYAYKYRNFDYEKEILKEEIKERNNRWKSVK